MELYHANKEIVQYPEVRKARYTKDFSWGFYCTNNFKQAVRWANRGIGDPIINYYEYKPNEKLNILKLRKIENNSFINYIYRYNIVKIHNNNIKLKKSSDYLTFMTKKSEQYANDIRAYKRSK